MEAIFPVITTPAYPVWFTFFALGVRVVIILATTFLLMKDTKTSSNLKKTTLILLLGAFILSIVFEQLIFGSVNLLRFLERSPNSTYVYPEFT